MGTHDQLLEMYDELLPVKPDRKITLCVVPLIRYNYKRSDYLYLLYRDIIENRKQRFDVESISVWRHWVFVWKALISRNTILHYHWLECTDIKSLAGIAYKLICIALFKLLGGTLVWTIHNKMPHDQAFGTLNLRIRRWMASKADRIHIHCSGMIDDIADFYQQPASKFRVVDHPAFPSEYVSRNDAIERIRDERNLPIKETDTLFLMFGNISSYKQIDKVCELFVDLAANKKLLIVGPVKKGQMSHFKKIKEYARRHENILLVPHFISEKMVPFYMHAADCVVFNYRQILTSGGVELAKSYGRPVIAPALGCLAEVNDENIVLFDTQAELKQLIETFEPKLASDA